MESLQRKLIYHPGGINSMLGWRVVSPADFERNSGRDIDAKEASSLSLIPYCLDFERKLIFHVVGLDPSAAAEAAFHYVYLRENASGLLEVPAECVRLGFGSSAASTAILFSPGRCGSTLLVKMAGVMGLTSVSEPDFYSQLAEYPVKAKGSPADLTLAVLMAGYAGRTLLEPFIRRGASSFLIKMRAHANLNPSLVMASVPQQSKVIFITRGFEDWCDSRMRAFRNSLESNLKIYSTGLRALHWLKRNTDCLVIDYDEIISAPLEVARKLSAHLGADCDEAALSGVLSQDSQSGTSLARDRINAPLAPEAASAIHDIWRSKAPVELLRELELDRSGRQCSC